MSDSFEKRINEKIKKELPKFKRPKNINTDYDFDFSIFEPQEKSIFIDVKSPRSLELPKLKKVSKDSLFAYAGYSANKSNYDSKTETNSISEQKQKFNMLSILPENTYVENTSSTKRVFEVLVKEKMKPNDVLIVTNIDICSKSISGFLKLQDRLFEKSIILISLDFLYSKHKYICELIEENGLDKLRFFHPFSKSGGYYEDKLLIDNNLFSLLLNNAGNFSERKKEIRQSQLRIAYIILYYCSMQISEIGYFTKKHIELIISNNSFGRLGEGIQSVRQCPRLIDHCAPNFVDEIIKKLKIDFQVVFEDYEYQFLFGKDRPITNKNLIRIINDDLRNTSEKYCIPCILTSDNLRDSISDNLSKFLRREKTRIIPNSNYTYTSCMTQILPVYYNPDTNQVAVIEKINSRRYMLFKLPALEMNSVESDQEVYNRQRHSELLKLMKSNKTLTPIEKLEFKKYFNMLEGRMRWETKEAYVNMTNAFLRKQIDFDLFCNSFKQRNDLSKRIVNDDILADFENKSFVLCPDDRSNQFSDYITKIDRKIKILKNAYLVKTLFMSSIFKSQSNLSINQSSSELKEVLIEFVQKYS